MSTEIFQVRDVPADDARAIRARAKSRNMSLSNYLRELIHEDASRPSMSETLARIASRDAVEASDEDVRSFIDDGQR